MQSTLRDGLILRSISEGHASDRDNLPQFYVDTFSDAYEQDESFLGPWTQSLLAPDHPCTTDDDVWVVVDPAQDDRIVSALLLIPQTWRYEEVRLGVGRVEIVATNKDYRQRGLVRALFDVAHARSDELGHTIQSVTGIEHYYRRYGYTLAVDLGGRAALPLAAIKPIADGQTPRYTLRPATEADIPDLIAWDDHAARDALLSTVRGEAEWRYELIGRTQPGHIWKLHVLIIQDAVGVGVGYVALRDPYEQWNSCLAYIVGPRASYLATYEDVMRGLRAHLEAADPNRERPFLSFGAALPPTVEMLIRHNYPAVVRDEMYAWYLRAASPARLINQIAPVLERRLAASGAQGYTGTLTIYLFDMTALEISFDAGRISAREIALTSPKAHDDADAAFPWHTLLNLVFGHRDFMTMRRALPEIHASGRARVLLDALFPQKPSMLLPMA